MHPVKSVLPAGSLVLPDEVCCPVNLKDVIHKEDIDAGDKHVTLNNSTLWGKITTTGGYVEIAEGSVVRADRQLGPAVTTDSGFISLRNSGVEGSIVAKQGNVRMHEANLYGDLTLEGGVRSPGGAAAYPLLPLNQTAHLSDSLVTGNLRGSDLRLQSTTIRGHIDLDCEAAALRGDEARIVILGRCQTGEIQATGRALIIVNNPRWLPGITGGHVVVLDMSPEAAYQRLMAADQLPRVDDPLDKPQWRQFQHALYTLCQLPDRIPGVDGESRRSSVMNRAQELAQLLRAWADKDVKGLTEQLGTVWRSDELGYNLAAIGTMLLASVPSPQIDLLIDECARLARSRGVTRSAIGKQMTNMGATSGAVASRETEGAQPHPPVTAHLPVEQFSSAFQKFWKAIGPS
ncbi:hypothetical protein SAMN05216359_10358 [Roseateles sp. YR242]|uniref:hypothetical protein n=1 Tax=Roseateles sp. YR242 TaxID=1855305 RepID=UPI0008BB341A|nr:hypothetical protein [Roseateles sp. YR242]SEK78193.1 hypothetical protein SAMN05216359_10358 [Roseateles sp. YR242]